MLKLMKFKWLLIKYKTIFADILEGFTIEKEEAGQIILHDKNKNEFRIGLIGNNVNCYYKDEIMERIITFQMLENDDLSDIEVLEIQKENRPNGCIIEEITRNYGFSRFSKEERVLLDLLSERYVFNKNIEIKRFYDTGYREANSLFQTTFESHMKNLVKSVYDIRYYTDSPYSTKTFLNGEDISIIFATVEGKDKISRVFDLYNGNITKRNNDDIKAIDLGLLRKESFGYKEISGITKKEDEICGVSLLPKNNKEHIIMTRLYAPLSSNGRVTVGGGESIHFANIKGNERVMVDVGDIPMFVNVKNGFVRRLIRKISGKE